MISKRKCLIDCEKTERPKIKKLVKERERERETEREREREREGEGGRK